MKVRKTLLVLAMVSLSLSSYVKAGDEHNHVNIDQVNSGDNLNLGIEQVGHTNLVKFSFDHDNNTINLLQEGNSNYIGWTDAWGSGYSWGGDLDGLRNEVDIRQKCSLTSCADNDFQLFWYKKWLERIRILEIQEWLKNNQVDKWVAIDDLNMSPEFNGGYGLENFVLTPRSTEGIKQSGIKEKILGFLK